MTKDQILKSLGPNKDDRLIRINYIRIDSQEYNNVHSALLSAEEYLSAIKSGRLGPMKVKFMWIPSSSLVYCPTIANYMDSKRWAIRLEDNYLWFI